MLDGRTILYGPAFHLSYRGKAKNELEYGILHRQFMVMESKLWWIITTPSMYLAVLAGLMMLYVTPALLKAPWMHVKLVFVLGLLVYHFTCQRILFRLKKEQSKWTSTQLRLWNELATVILFAIVFIVVLKSATHWIYGLTGLLLLSVMLMVAVKLYKRFREH